MNNVITKAGAGLKNGYSLLRRTTSKHPKKATALGVGFVLVLGFFIFTQGEEPTNDSSEKIQTVELASVRALSLETEPITVLGEVRSVSQAELRAQKSGKVTQVYVSAGQYVQAGTILAEIENASERAMVLSAQASLASAQAQYEKTQFGARSEDKSTAVVQAQSSLATLQTAKDGASNAFAQAYSVAQDAIFAQVDDFFSNPYTVNPSFRVRSASYDERQVLEKERVAIGAMLATWDEELTTVSREIVDEQTLQVATERLERIKSFLDQISLHISKQEVNGDLSASEKATQEGVILSARASVNGAINTVNGARTALINAQSASQIARLNESKTVIGARSEDLLTSQAQVTQAQGALASAYATLENSIIRAPISGTVTSLSVNKGDFVSMLESVAVVAREGASEIVVFVSDDVRSRIATGNTVIVDGKHEGVVTSVAPGLDPVTKNARVTIGMSGEVPLTNGAFVRLEIIPTTTGEDEMPEELFVPISAVKVLPQGFAVFTVSDEGVVTALPITEGPIVGSTMRVVDGVEPETRIVVDVRGISEGDTVTIEE